MSKKMAQPWLRVGESERDKAADVLPGWVRDSVLDENGFGFRCANVTPYGEKHGVRFAVHPGIDLARFGGEFIGYTDTEERAKAIVDAVLRICDWEV